MPSGSSLIAFTYVNIMFLLQLSLMVILGNVKQIKDNWPLYRCNPLFMGLSDNLSEDFTYCVQNMQTDYFGVLVQPLNEILGSLSNLGETLTGNIGEIGSFISNLRDSLTNLFQSIFGIFSNITVVVEKIGFSLIDVLKRLLAAMLVGTYGTIAGMDAMGSMVNIIVNVSKGKIQDVVCFSPHTILKLNNKEQKKIKNIKIGDVLENGSKVTGILKLFNKDYMYNLKEKRSKKNIYVTGKHFVFYKKDIVYVEQHPNFELTNKICPCVYNLITDNHLIPIQEYLFWDYNDDILNYKK